MSCYSHRNIQMVHFLCERAPGWLPTLPNMWGRAASWWEGPTLCILSVMRTPGSGCWHAPHSPRPPPPPPPLPPPVSAKLRPPIPVRFALPVDVHHVQDPPQGRPLQQAAIQGSLRGERWEADWGAGQGPPSQETTPPEDPAWTRSLQQGNLIN